MEHPPNIESRRDNSDAQIESQDSKLDIEKDDSDVSDSGTDSDDHSEYNSHYDNYWSQWRDPIEAAVLQSMPGDLPLARLLIAKIHTDVDNSTATRIGGWQKQIQHVAGSPSSQETRSSGNFQGRSGGSSKRPRQSESGNWRSCPNDRDREEEDDDDDDDDKGQKDFNSRYDPTRPTDGPRYACPLYKCDPKLCINPKTKIVYHKCADERGFNSIKAVKYSNTSYRKKSLITANISLGNISGEFTDLFSVNVVISSSPARIRREMDSLRN